MLMSVTEVVQARTAVASGALIREAAAADPNDPFRTRGLALHPACVVAGPKEEYLCQAFDSNGTPTTLDDLHFAWQRFH